MDENKVCERKCGGHPNVPYVPFIAFESEQAMMERTIKRLWIVTVLMALVTGLMAVQFYLHFFA